MMNYQMFINMLDQLTDTECKEIYLEGSGEPTMNKKLPDFVKAGTDRGFKMSFTKLILSWRGLSVIAKSIEA